MRKYEMNKFPKLAVIMTIVGLFLAVVAMSISLMFPSVDNLGGLAILEIVATVLVLAGLTTAKVVLLRVINTILTVCLLITSFVLAVVKFSNRDVFLFAASILMLVASILALIYFLTMKNPRITKMYLYAGTAFSILTAAYAIIYVVEDLIEVIQYGVEGHFGTYFLLLAFAVVSFLPVATHRSLDVIDEPDEPAQIEEQPQEDLEEVKEEQ